MDFKEQITNSCVNGVGSRCGDCCTGFSIPLSMNEADAINSYVRRNGVKRLNRDWLSDKSCAVDIRCCFYDSVEKRHLRGSSYGLFGLSVRYVYG